APTSSTSPGSTSWAASRLQPGSRSVSGTPGQGNPFGEDDGGLQAPSGIPVEHPCPPEGATRMDPPAQFPALLAALMVCAMLAGFMEAFAANRKVRDDRRRYQQRMKRKHGAPPPGARGRPRAP